MSENISETVQDRDMVAMKVGCGLSNGIIANALQPLIDPEGHFYCLKIFLALIPWETARIY